MAVTLLPFTSRAPYPCNHIFGAVIALRAMTDTHFTKGQDGSGTLRRSQLVCPGIPSAGPPGAVEAPGQSFNCHAW